MNEKWSNHMRKIMWVFGCFILVGLIALPIKETMEVFDPITFPLVGTTIVLDAGHGGADGGATFEGTEEKEIALIIVKMLRAYLEEAGATVYVTREDDADLADDETKGMSKRKSEDIRKRLAFIEEKDADLYLSIHLNALADKRWHGAQTFYNPNKEQNKQIAETIQRAFITHLENTDRQALAIDNIYLIKHAETPGALVEVGFLSNPDERKQLKNKSYQRKIASSIYFGILEYVTICNEWDEANECEG